MRCFDFCLLSSKIINQSIADQSTVHYCAGDEEVALGLQTGLARVRVPAYTGRGQMYSMHITGSSQLLSHKRLNT
jgi:hypothetical protein